MNKISSMGRKCIATDIGTRAPVHKVRYAAMHIGHFAVESVECPSPHIHLLCCFVAAETR